MLAFFSLDVGLCYGSCFYKVFFVLCFLVLWVVFCACCVLYYLFHLFYSGSGELVGFVAL